MEKIPQPQPIPKEKSKEAQALEDKWFRELWNYERSSLISLVPFPSKFSEQHLASYLRKNKKAQKIGSSSLLWLAFFWLPLSLITVVACGLWLTGIFKFLLFVQPFIAEFIFLIFSIAIALLRVFNSAGAKAGNVVLYILGWLVALLVLLPFIPLLWVRQHQLHQATSWKQSFKIAFWRTADPKFIQPIHYQHDLDVWLRQKYMDLKKNSQESVALDIKEGCYASFADYLIPILSMGAVALQWIVFITLVLVLIAAGFLL